MNSRLRRWLFSFCLIALIATGCASDGDDTTEAATTGNPVETPTAEPVETAEPTPTSIPVPANDSAADEAIAGLDAEPLEPGAEAANADRSTTATGFVQSRFNIDPDPEWVQCMVAETEGNDALDLALQTPSVGQGEIDDSQLKALTFAMNGCVDTIGLADWATQAVGPQGEVRETAPECIVERFDNAERGDITFYTFVSLTYQFRVEPEGVPDVLDMLVTCTPISSLADFFANQAEQAANFETVVDRECLLGELQDPGASETFWSTLIEGLVPPVSAVAPFIDACSEVATSDFNEDVPADFVAWAGTGALSAVAPAARAGIYDTPPPMTIDTAASYEAVLATGGGEVRIRLFADTAPVTVNNFVSLARDGYFDGTIFHRVLDGFMAQGGDPTGTGTGGPGYQFADEVDGGPALDRKGLLAMANAGPGTNGSQFFITFVPTDWLTGNHTVFGEVIEGIDIVDAIERRDPSAPSGRGQVLESVTVIEG